MNLNLFLAKRIGSKADATGKLGKMGSRISIFSVTVSIIVIVIASSVADGFRDEILGKARGYSSDYILAAPGEDILSTSTPVTHPLSYLKDLEELPFVGSIKGVAYTHGILKEKDEIGGIILKGVDSTYNMDFYAKHLIAGRLPSLGGKRVSNEIIISKTLADMLQYKAGDKATTYFAGEQPRVRRFDIVGIFDAQLQDFDKYLAITDIRQTTRLNGWEGKISGYELLLEKGFEEDAENAAVIEETIYNKTSEEDTPVAATPLKEKYYIFYDWLHLLDLNVLIILALMMAVAGFNMVSALLIMLFERISQIGLLKAMGMSNRAVSKVFLTKAAITVLQGMAIGNCIALLLCVLQQRFEIIPLDPENYFVSHVPISIEWTSVLTMNLVAFATIMLVMLLPTIFIGKINPATTMRVK
ncbi:MAG: ABC transporter permease [Bacteroidales bacterium]|nr:ABC transporter permease [Bacteroidales bacterium]